MITAIWPWSQSCDHDHSHVIMITSGHHVMSRNYRWLPRYSGHSFTWYKLGVSEALQHLCLKYIFLEVLDSVFNYLIPWSTCGCPSNPITMELKTQVLQWYKNIQTTVHVTTTSFELFCLAQDGDSTDINLSTLRKWQNFILFVYLFIIWKWDQKDVQLIPSEME